MTVRVLGRTIVTAVCLSATGQQRSAVSVDRVRSVAGREVISKDRPQ